MTSQGILEEEGLFGETTEAPMIGENVLDRIRGARDGTPVFSSDGKRIGKVRALYSREADVHKAEVYVEVVTPVPLWRRWQLKPKHLFLPGTTVAEVTEQGMRLNVDATEAEAYIPCPPGFYRLGSKCRRHGGGGRTHHERGERFALHALTGSWPRRTPFLHPPPSAACAPPLP